MIEPIANAAIAHPVGMAQRSEWNGKSVSANRVSPQL
jgi:hypothetical protein